MNSDEAVVEIAKVMTEVTEKIVAWQEAVQSNLSALDAQIKELKKAQLGRLDPVKVTEEFEKKDATIAELRAALKIDSSRLLFAMTEPRQELHDALAAKDATIAELKEENAALWQKAEQQRAGRVVLMQAMAAFARKGEESTKEWIKHHDKAMKATRLRSDAVVAHVNVAAKDATIDELRALLREIEWAGEVCPWCGEERTLGHTDGCRLAAALAGKEGK